MDGKVLGGRLWWIFMVIMSIINLITATFVQNETLPANGLEAIDEEEEPPEETWEFERPAEGQREVV